MKYIFAAAFSISFLYHNCLAQNNLVDMNNKFKKGQYYFYAKNPTAKSDSLAKKHFSDLASILPFNNVSAEIILKSNEYNGVISQSNGDNLHAKLSYLKALNINPKFIQSDTLIFRPLLYLSSIYYSIFQFDSCYFLLNRAEKILEKHPNLAEAERLYNSFGMLNFEGGNYRQSLQYFQKANFLRKTGNNSYDFSFRNNMASALQNLKKSDSSLVIYQQLLKEFPLESGLKLNLASCYNVLNLPKKAEAILKTINLKSIKDQQTNYYNLLAKSLLAQNNYTQAKTYFEKALEKSYTETLAKKSILRAVTFLYLGKISEKQAAYPLSLKYYQKSLINLDNNFNDENIAANPTNFNDGFNSFDLLKTLSAKALCLKNIYAKNHQKKYFEWSNASFEQVLKLIKSIATSQNSEESRLDFKADIQYYFKAYFDLLLAEYNKSDNEFFLRRAFEVADAGKAEILSLTINEQNMKASTDLPFSLINYEKILRLSKNAIINQLETAQPTNVGPLQIKLNDLNIKIARLNEQMDKFPKFHTNKYENFNLISLATIQKKLSNRDLILYYFEGLSQSSVFLIGKNTLEIHNIKNRKSFEQNVATLLKRMKNVESQSDLLNSVESHKIYNELIMPFQHLFSRNTNLIFIPDGHLNGLPIEVLKNAENQYLIENWPVSYLYSAKFIDFFENKINAKTGAFAPFINKIKGFENLFLPGSNDEIRNIPNAIKFADVNATKEEFSNKMSDYQVIHLATHAITNVEQAEKSYIQFYPKGANLTQSRLFLYELSPGVFKNNSLVFLSACESYGDKNIDGEGIRGLSRAFYLAGSKNVISALWKAEDFATAYISKQFYRYVSEGKSYEKALQMAKIDLINDPNMAQFQSPQYWAHLVLIGNRFSEPNYFNPLIILLASTIMIILILMLAKNPSFLRLKS